MDSDCRCRSPSVSAVAYLLARFLYASPAWWVSDGVQDRQKLQGFFSSQHPDRILLQRPNFSDICLEADQNLFRKVHSKLTSSQLTGMSHDQKRVQMYHSLLYFRAYRNFTYTVFRGFEIIRLFYISCVLAFSVRKAG